MTNEIKHHINGKWISGTGRQTTTVINPATEEVLGHTPMGTVQDVDKAVSAAQEAFKTWRKTPAIERIQPLFRLKHLMEAAADDLAKQITEEHGKTFAESRGSVRRAIQMVEVATSITSLMKGENFEDIASGIDCSTVQRPMGVFAGITPFNFPAMVPFWFWPFAVATGNTYVLKPSERVPLTSMRVFDLLLESGLPAGVINMVHGGKEVVDRLCTHPDIKGVSFVGSTPVAKHVYQTAATHGKRAQSLGGAKNIMVVMPDAMSQQMQQKTVATAVESITGCAGERCLAGSLVLCVGDDTYQAFTDSAVRQARSIKVGNGLEPGSTMGPLISAEAKERVDKLISTAVQDGCKILLDGREGYENQKGYFMGPTVLADVKEDMEIAKTEIFGPVILLSKVNSLKESIEWINSLELANTTTLFTSSGATAREFTYSVDPSMIGINIGVPAPMAFFSFGGSKQSFFGDIKAHGKDSVNFFTDTYTTIYRWYGQDSIW